MWGWHAPAALLHFDPQIRVQPQHVPLHVVSWACAQPTSTLTVSKCTAGKGRQLAGLIRMFWEQEGGRRILWLSVSQDLERVSAVLHSWHWLYSSFAGAWCLDVVAGWSKLWPI